MTRIRYTRAYPLPAYTGPQPVYVARPQWAGAVACWVRRNGNEWETAPATGYLQNAAFHACPVSTAALTRNGAVMAFDYYFNTLRVSA